MNIQPIINFFFPGGWNASYSGNILVDREAPSDNGWTVPIGVGVGKVVEFGRPSHILRQCYGAFASPW